MNNLSKRNFRLQCIADIIALLLAFTLSFFWRFRMDKLPFLDPGVYIAGTYSTLLPGILVLYLFIAYFSLARENYYRRTATTEILSVTKTDILLVILLIVYFFFSRSSIRYSRAFMAFFAVLFWIFSFMFRTVLRKIILPNLKKSAEQIVVIGKYEALKEKLPLIVDESDWRIRVCGAAATDINMKGDYIEGVEVIARPDEILPVINTYAADSVLMIPDLHDKEETERMAIAIHDSGKTVRVDFSSYDLIKDANFTLDRVGSCNVVTYLPLIRINARYRFLKKILDIFFAILLMPLLGLVALLSAIFLNIESKGPVIMAHVRVGKNGRRFEQYRFRILRMDAKERIREGKNPMTIWGRFLCFSHLERLPLILNVLLSDMSFVGPHAPTLPRYIEYGRERRKNLCVEPGITGYWAFVKDEDKITYKDRAYVSNWGYLKDIALLVEFLLRFITGTFPRKFDQNELDEGLMLIDIYVEERQPLFYDHSLYKAPAGIRIGLYHFFKRLIDIVIALCAIIALSPLFLVLMILVIGTDGGSPFYAHRRIGFKGKRIHVFKFRTMRTDAGDLRKLLTPEQLREYQKEFKIDNDPRITKIGNFLRRSSLDELPQLFNVLGGSLSFVGPRPIVERETKIYGDEIGKLLSVKPGLTGYWQAYARNNATYESGERQKMEMFYVEHASLKLDIKIFFKTFSTVAKGDGAK